MKMPPRLLAPLFLLAGATGACVGAAKIYVDGRHDAVARSEALTLAAAPLYAPHRWNARQDVLKNNNCYAYAADDIDTVEYGAMPGHRTLGQPAPQYHTPYFEWLRRLTRGAIADGMIHTGDKPASKPGYYRVVLLMHPDYDGYGFPYHHWLRQAPDGTWSGKDGPTPATDRDRNGHGITDPETASFGFNKHTAKPVAYFLVPMGGLDVGNPDEPKSHRASRPAYRATAQQLDILAMRF